MQLTRCSAHCAVTATGRWCHLSELKPSMDYGTLEGWAYRLVRLFWWEVLQINPAQTDLRLTPQVAAE